MCPAAFGIPPALLQPLKDSTEANAAVVSVPVKVVIVTSTVFIFSYYYFFASKLFQVLAAFRLPPPLRAPLLLVPSQGPVSCAAVGATPATVGIIILLNLLGPYRSLCRQPVYPQMIHSR